jgi:hypothetical protein
MQIQRRAGCRISVAATLPSFSSAGDRSFLPRRLVLAAGSGAAAAKLPQPPDLPPQRPQLLDPVRDDCCDPPLSEGEGPVVIRAVEANFGEQAPSPLICTEGQPSAACDVLLRQLARPVLHSGDFEWGGLRVAGVMRRRYRACPWRHGVADYERALARLPERAPALDAPRGNAPEGFESLWRRLADRRIPVWQEDLLERLVEDMAMAR